jgi:hypothetical protein
LEYWMNFDGQNQTFLYLVLNSNSDLGW